MSECERCALLVEQDPDQQILLGDFLNAYGIDYVTEPDPEIAICRLENNEVFDVVLIDLVLARKGRWQFLKWVRNGLGLDSVTLPIIVVGMHYDSDILRVQAFKYGASAYYSRLEPPSVFAKYIKIHAGLMRSKYYGT